MAVYQIEDNFISRFESSVMIHHLILREKESGNNNPNLIISKDLYPLQITCLHDDTVYMKPKKAFGEELTRITLPFDNDHTY